MTVAVAEGLSNSARSLAKTPRQHWPTPSAQEAGQSPEFLASLVTKDGDPAKPGERVYDPRTGKHVQRTLNRAVNLWPTPTASEQNTSSTQAEARKRSNGICLADAVRHWPTPTAEDGESKGMSAKRLATRAPDNLATAVRWASPSASDHKGTSGANCLAFQRGAYNRLADQVSGGQLNPTWVEWLMGLPARWTDVSGSSD
jgi:DNA (cytosine-5)-methyltransferase 1